MRHDGRERENAIMVGLGQKHRLIFPPLMKRGRDPSPPPADAQLLSSWFALLPELRPLIRARLELHQRWRLARTCQRALGEEDRDHFYFPARWTREVERDLCQERPYIGRLLRAVHAQRWHLHEMLADLIPVYAAAYSLKGPWASCGKQLEFTIGSVMTHRVTLSMTTLAVREPITIRAAHATLGPVSQVPIDPALALENMRRQCDMIFRMLI